LTTPSSARRLRVSAIVKVTGIDHPVSPCCRLRSHALRRVQLDLGREGGPRFGDVLAERDGAWVVTVTDELQSAIATSGDDQLANVAASVAADEEYADTEPELLAGLLAELAALARRATAKDMRLYCWMSL
ncbi:MAG TPA: hypothetical protein VFM55_03220, partial [Micromonosporaceae bacterium]|nr:hypothetical protein [Micromonosporaceae bacterium]